MLVTKSKSKRGYVKGDPWYLCDQTSQRFRRSETVEQWDGLIVWKDIHEPRHPQEFVRGVRDDFAVRNPRPQSAVESLLDGSNTASGTIVLPDTVLAERDNDILYTRSGDFILARGTPDYFGTIIEVDLGSTKDVSHVRLTLTSYDGSRDDLAIYTSTDGVNYTICPVQGQEILESITLGSETYVLLGARARYVKLGALVLSPVAIEYNVTQFDIYGTS